MFGLFGPDKTFKFKMHYYSSLMHNNEELDKFYGNMSGCFLSIIPQKKNILKNISELVVGSGEHLDIFSRKDVTVTQTIFAREMSFLCKNIRVFSFHYSPE